MIRSGRLLLRTAADPTADRSPRQRDVEYLLAALTTRDVAILNALHQHRYLDVGHVERLFFSGNRRCELRLQRLRQEHLVRQWLAHEPPGWRRRKSIQLLSVFGATVLAGCLGQPAHAFVRRARLAGEGGLHVVHDLEANGFFIDLALASRELPDQGLYHWVGEESCRLTYRSQGAALSPDGWGRYLTGSGEIVFMVEWDRGTESLRRLRDKVQTYARHFLGRDDAYLNHVLFVVPDRAREEALTTILASVREPRRHRACCSFWTTDAGTVRQHGALGAVWRAGDESRLPLTAMAAHPISSRLAAFSVAKPGWWEHRPGGSEGG